MLHSAELQPKLQPGTVSLEASVARRSRVRVGRLGLLDVVVIVAALNYLALVVEAQHRHSRERKCLVSLGPAALPFNGGPFARDDRLAEPALDILLGREILVEMAADAR